MQFWIRECKSAYNGVSIVSVLPIPSNFNNVFVVLYYGLAMPNCIYTVYIIIAHTCMPSAFNVTASHSQSVCV